MAKTRTITQKIAVFGQSGSGKTVLISSFYGPLQDPEFLKHSFYEVRSDSTQAGIMLHQNFVKMKKDNTAPVQNRFDDHTFRFSVLPQEGNSEQKIELEWHDYPGEWFETDPATSDEQAERISTFQSLMTSDLAIILVDGAKLLANKGEEERYLKVLFNSYRQSFETLRNKIIGNGSKQDQFPRVWIIALSKADLWPDFTVHEFRDLIVGKAAGEIVELTRTLTKFVSHEQSFSLGEEFLLLSSAKFEDRHIDVTKRTGVDLILPLAGVHPISKFASWRKFGKIPPSIADKLKFIDAAPLVTKGIRMASERITVLKRLSVSDSAVVMILTLLDAAVSEVKSAQGDAMKKHDFFGSLMAEFVLSLKEAEKQRKLLRSRR